jgi:hypothetical protein
MTRICWVVGLVLVLAGCDLTVTGTVDVEVPYCPVSPSAWAAADSVPLGCVVP